MDHSELMQEYYSRVGLREAQGDIAKALVIAGQRYQAHLNRELTIKELAQMRQVTEEMLNWSATKSYTV